MCGALLLHSSQYRTKPYRHAGLRRPRSEANRNRDEFCGGCRSGVMPSILTQPSLIALVDGSSVYRAHASFRRARAPQDTDARGRVVSVPTDTGTPRRATTCVAGICATGCFIGQACRRLRDLCHEQPPFESFWLSLASATSDADRDSVMPHVENGKFRDACVVLLQAKLKPSLFQVPAAC
jgi:hypothetical protein